MKITMGPNMIHLQGISRLGVLSEAGVGFQAPWDAGAGVDRTVSSMAWFFDCGRAGGAWSLPKDPDFTGLPMPSATKQCTGFVYHKQDLCLSSAKRRVLGDLAKHTANGGRSV